MSRHDEIAGRRFWIVGASSGIGAALARELRGRGAEVAISARSVDDLHEIAGHEMVVVPLDATDRDAVRAAAADVDARLGIDTVVWCAGHWEQFDAAHWDADAFERHIEVNLLGLNNVLASVVPTMVELSLIHI